MRFSKDSTAEDYLEESKKRFLSKIKSMKIDGEEGLFFQYINTIFGPKKTREILKLYEWVKGEKNVD